MSTRGKRMAGYYRGKMAALVQEWGGRCQADGCGSTLRLEFAHVKPTGVTGRGRGLPQRYHDVKKHPDCFRLLCRACHLAYDAQHWQRLREELEAEEITKQAAREVAPEEPGPPDDDGPRPPTGDPLLTIQERALTHACAARGCQQQIAASMFMCRKHWFLVPLDLRERLWASYVPGREFGRDRLGGMHEPALRAIERVHEAEQLVRYGLEQRAARSRR